jgi:uncharacterized damage-inducible protein DinB
MNAEYFRRLFDYNYWAHQRVWACVLALSDEQFTRPCDYSVGSVHEQVVHTLSAESLWLTRVQGTNPPPALASPAELPTRAAIAAQWDAVENDWRAYLATLRDDDLSQVVTYVSLNGKLERRNYRWEGLMQILTHGVDHRAQTLALIHQVGGKTIEQDFIFYSWEKPGV